MYELNKIIEIKQKIYRDDLIYKTGDNKKDKIYEFQKFKTIKKSFRREIYKGKLMLEVALEQEIKF